MEIYNSTVPVRMLTTDTEPISVESRLAWFHEPDIGCGRGGEIPGWLSFEPFRRRPACHATVEVSVYVVENYRRKGIGKRIVAEAIPCSPGFGLKPLTAGAFAHNGTSLRLFEGFCLERWARFPKVAELDGIERDLVVLGLRLDKA